MTDRLGVGVIGAGRVGAVLASCLRAAGHEIVAVTGGSDATLDRIGALLPHVRVAAAADIVAACDLVLVAVPDDDLADVVGAQEWRPGQIVVHVAGRYGTGVLEPAARAGAIVIALHPAMTFTGTSLDVARLVGCPFAVTAARTVQPIAMALVVEMGGEPFLLAEDARPLYHAALAHGANHLVVLVAQAEQALRAAGVDDPAAVLGPLVTAALDGALRDDPIATLTGPVARGDAGTVRAHLDQLTAADASGDLTAAYRQLALSATMRVLAARRITGDQAQRLTATLLEDE